MRITVELPDARAAEREFACAGHVELSEVHDAVVLDDAERGGRERGRFFDGEFQSRVGLNADCSLVLKQAVAQVQVEFGPGAGLDESLVDELIEADVKLVAVHAAIAARDGGDRALVHALGVEAAAVIPANFDAGVDGQLRVRPTVGPDALRAANIHNAVAGDADGLLFIAEISFDVDRGARERDRV